MCRDKIDWNNLPVIGSRRKQLADKELLAAIKHSRYKAKHKGRNHVANYKRRLAKEKKESQGKKEATKDNKKLRDFKNEVRRYYLGERDSYPKK